MLSLADAAWQVPALSIFESSLRRGKFDANRKLSNGGMLEFTHIYPMDAVYDTPEDVPEDVSHQTWNGQKHLLHIPTQLAVDCITLQNVKIQCSCMT